jgi:uncharacterized membrane protein
MRSLRREYGQVNDDRLREEELESRWEAAPAVGLVIAFQLTLGIVSRVRDWKLSGLAWWFWLVAVGPELALLFPLAVRRHRRRLEQLGHRRTATLVLLGVMAVVNLTLLAALLVSVVRGRETSGGQLLLKAAAVWSTNIIAFALCFWEFDGGGPMLRMRPKPPPPDFQFPQMVNPELAEPGWYPQFVDYLYVSFTGAMAFSPTDTMPLRRRAKLLMLAESSISALTVLLVAARAVNIFK